MTGETRRFFLFGCSRNAARRLASLLPPFFAHLGHCPFQPGLGQPLRLVVALVSLGVIAYTLAMGSPLAIVQIASPQQAAGSRSTTAAFPASALFESRADEVAAGQFVFPPCTVVGPVERITIPPATAAHFVDAISERRVPAVFRSPFLANWTAFDEWSLECAIAIACFLCFFCLLFSLFVFGCVLLMHDECV